MMKRIAAALVPICLLLCLLPSCLPLGSTGAIRLNWGVALPDGCEEVYSADTGASPHGDGVRYHVFRCGDAEGMEKLCTRSGEEAAERAGAFLDGLNVPQEQRPDYASCALHYQRQEDNSELFMLWDSGRELVYVVESFL